jgi:putative nucleotidyltransferase with HDIG domain
MDIIQWAYNSKRSGTLILTCLEQNKKFYFQDGNVIYVESNKINEQLIRILMLELSVSQLELQQKLHTSDDLELPFLSYLISENLISKEALKKLMDQVAQTAVTDVLKWQAGEFEFTDELPSKVLNGPIELNSTQLLLEAVGKFDESQMEQEVETSLVTNEIRNKLMGGNVDLPTVPDIIQRILEKIEDTDSSIEKVVDCITDQILVAKILRICNSPYFKTASKVSTLKEAVVLMGLKTLLSIVTVHSLGSFSSKNEAEVRKILSHSLVCGMIARQIAHDMGRNSDLAFICGLLHDIGKTIMLDMLDGYMLSLEQESKVIEENHAEIGYLLAMKWNFGEDILECIRYHHSPDKATINRSMVELVYLANSMAHTSDQAGSHGEIFLSMAQCNCHSESGRKSKDIQQDRVNKLIGQVDNVQKEAREYLI